MKQKHLLFIFILTACLALATRGWAQQNAPTDVQAATGNQSAAVSFQAPVADSGSTITGYTVASSPAGGTDSNAGSTSLLHVVTGLTNGVAYTFTVTATNSASGTSPASKASNSVTPSDNAYAAYAGTWHDSTITTGGAPYGQTMIKTVSADGTFTLSGTDSNGAAIDMHCTAWLFPYGMTGTCDQAIPVNLLWYVNPSNTVASCTGTTNGGAYFGVSIKQASTSYSMSSDLPGIWNYNSLETQSGGGDQWSQANASVSSSGAMSGTSTNSNGNTKPSSGALSLSSTGLIACTSGDCNGAGFYLDADKNVAAGLGVLSSTDLQLQILSKQAASYSLSDLAGYWAGNQLRTDGTWRRFLVQVNDDGSYMESQTNSDGTTSSGAGTLAISSTGAVSCASVCSNNVDMVLDASKTVMTGTQTHGSGVLSIQVFTKAKSLWSNAVALGGDWLWLRWFGYFSTGSAPWIYHLNHGWLYPFGSLTSGVWFWDSTMNAFWWTDQATYPYVYRANGDWLWYQEGTSNPRFFYNFTTGKWEKH